MHVGKLPSAIPVLQAELGISFFTAGLLLSLIQFAGMCFAMLLGSLTGRMGLKRCVLTGLLLLTIASGAGSMTVSVSPLLFLRVLEGFGFLLVTLSGPALIRQLAPPQTLQVKVGLWGSYMGGGMGISLILTPVLIGIAGWQSVWLLLAAVTLLLFFAVKHYVPPSPNNHASSRLITETLRHPPAWALACLFGLYSGQWFSLVGFLPSIYQESQISLSTAGTLTAAVSIINAVGTFICGLLLQRGLPPKILIQTGYLLLGTCALTFYGFREFFPFIIQYGLVLSFSLFGGLIVSVLFSKAIQFAPSPAAISTTVGLILQVSAVSQFILPPLFAKVVSDTHTWFWVGIVMAALSFAGLCLSEILFRLRLAKA